MIRGGWNVHNILTIGQVSQDEKRSIESALILDGDFSTLTSIHLFFAGVAQLVEQLIRNQQVTSSSLVASSSGIKDLGH